MSRLSRRGVINSGGKTYDDWVAHVESIKNGTAAGSLPVSSNGPTATNIKVTPIAASGAMYGSSWGRWFTYDSALNRIIQHGMPSEAKFLSCAVAKIVLIDTELEGSRDLFDAVSRNGFTSIEAYNEGGLQSYICTRLAYWDEDLKAAMQTAPRNSTGPVPYTHANWQP